jgi:hypothetical protein
MITKAGHGKKEKKVLTKIIYIIIVIVYLISFSFVTYSYFNENRYWEFNTEYMRIDAEKGQILAVNADITNKTYNVISSDENYFISYHIYKDNGEIYVYENPRTALESIKSGTEASVLIQLKAPMEEGKYKIEIDIVKEGEYWFKDRGERPGVIYLTVV